MQLKVGTPANKAQSQEAAMNDIGSYLTLLEVSESRQLSVETVLSIVHSGIVEPQGDQPQRWVFEPKMVEQIRRAARLKRDLDLDWPAVALALHLNEDMDQLREQNRRLRLVLRSLAGVNIAG